MKTAVFGELRPGDEFWDDGYKNVKIEEVNIPAVGPVNALEEYVGEIFARPKFTPVYFDPQDKVEIER